MKTKKKTDNLTPLEIFHSELINTFSKDKLKKRKFLFEDFIDLMFLVSKSK